MHKILAIVILGSALAAAQNPTQTQATAAELLQKGIYAQETAGDLDGAIKIYRQIVDSHPTQREIGAQAQYRLGQALLEKGDAANASQEIQRLGWDYPDYKELIAAAKAASGPAKTIMFYTPGPGVQPMRAAYSSDQFLASQKEAVAQDLAAAFDLTRSMTMVGFVTQIQWINPAAWLTVSSPGAPATPFRVRLNSTGALAAQGWNKDTLKLGDQVTVVGAPARDGTSTVQASSVSANGVVLWSSAAMK